MSIRLLDIARRINEFAKGGRPALLLGEIEPYINSFTTEDHIEVLLLSTVPFYDLKYVYNYFEYKNVPSIIAGILLLLRHAHILSSISDKTSPSTIVRYRYPMVDLIMKILIKFMYANKEEYTAATGKLAEIFHRYISPSKYDNIDLTANFITLMYQFTLFYVLYLDLLQAFYTKTGGSDSSDGNVLFGIMLCVLLCIFVYGMIKNELYLEDASKLYRF